MTRSCSEFAEGIDAYAIGALDQEEARMLSAHAARCAACAALIESALRSSHALAFAVPLAQPSTTVKARVMVGAEALSASHDRARSHRRLMAAAAALLVVAIGALTWGAIGQYRTHVLEHRTSTGARSNAGGDLDETLVDVAMAPDAQRIQLTGTPLAPSASARYVWSAARGLGVLDVTQLPAHEGATYELTIVYAARRESGGTFTVDQDGDGELIVRDIEPSNDDRPRAFQVAITPASDEGGIVLTGTASD